MSQNIEARALHWALHGDTGTSSKAIAGVMTGKLPKDGYCYPHDGGDFGRCIGLLAAVPEWRSRLSEMRAVGPEWAAIVDHWEELEALFRKDGGDRLYRRMKEILDPIEAKNKRLIRFGSGAIYFPKDDE
jgi:hypothetical protein